MTTLRVGIIGASPGRGWAHEAYIPALRVTEGAELVAVSTSRAESAEEAGRTYGVPAFDDYRRLLERTDVDLVVVSVRVPKHAEIIRAVLDAGKHVLCEWALATDAQEAQELVDLARLRPEVRTFVALQARFSPAVRLVRETLESGAIGTLLATSLSASALTWGPVTMENYAYVHDPASGVSPLSISVPHTLDGVLSAVGPLASVHAAVTTRTPSVLVADTGATLASDVEDHVALVGVLESGALLNAYYRGGGSRAGDVRWELNGSEGDILVTTPNPRAHPYATLNVADLTVAIGRGDDPIVQEVHVPGDEHAGLEPPARNVARLWAGIVRDVRDGTREAADFERGLELQRLGAAARRSGAQLLPLAAVGAS